VGRGAVVSGLLGGIGYPGAGEYGDGDVPGYAGALG
jgi:hypothetical protein